MHIQEHSQNIAWWDILHLRPLRPIQPATWNHHCQHCNALLLSTENNSLCHGNGPCMLPHLDPLPTRMCLLFDNLNRHCHLIKNCRTINNLFSFAGIGVIGGFQHFAVGDGAGPPAVAITGRTYHLLRNTEIADHSIHWFLYDEGLQTTKAQQFGVHSTVVQAIKDDLSQVNPYVSSLDHFRASPHQQQHVVELKDYSSNGDFAAVMHASNSTTINPCLNPHSSTRHF